MTVIRQIDFNKRPKNFLSSHVYSLEIETIHDTTLDIQVWLAKHLEEDENPTLTVNLNQYVTKEELGEPTNFLAISMEDTDDIREFARSLLKAADLMDEGWPDTFMGKIE